MSNYSSILSTITDNIHENGNEEITGDLLGSVLQQMVTALGSYQYAGIATPASSPGTPDINVFYIAGTAGTYTNLGGFSVSAGELAFFTYDGTWAKASLPVQYVDLTSDQTIAGAKTFSDDATFYGNVGVGGSLTTSGGISSDGNIYATGSVTGLTLYEYDDDTASFLALSDKYMGISDAYTQAQVTALLALKQDVLTFDTEPTLSSTNPVTSGGVMAALQERDDAIYTLEQDKQDVLTFDTTPTENSTNPVTSGGVYAVLGDIETLLEALL